jgi:hypothetical protein
MVEWYTSDRNVMSFHMRCLQQFIYTFSYYIHLLPYQFATNKANHNQNKEAYVYYSFLPLSIRNKEHPKIISLY